MTQYEQNVTESAQYLKNKLPSIPEIAIVLGSGLGPLADKLQTPIMVPYDEVPHLCVSTAPDHKGRFVYGTLSGKTVLCMQGRLHGYEGYTPDQIAYPIAVMHTLGVRALILTNASGGINTSFSVGDLMLIEDQINLTGKSPLTGSNHETLGTRFPDMTFAYAPALRECARAAAKDCGITLRHGVYVGTCGPQFETPAEIRAFRALGGDAVGMSTVFEAICASHCGLPTVGIAMITNMAAGVLMQPLSGAEVNEIAEQRGPVFEGLIAALVARISV